jgi:hypothetical protein
LRSRAIAAADLEVDIALAVSIALPNYGNLPGRRNLNTCWYQLEDRVVGAESRKPSTPAVFVEYEKRPVLPSFMINLLGTSFVLTYDGRAIEMSAREQILAPLLFPDLPQRFASSGK